VDATLGFESGELFGILLLVGQTAVFDLGGAAGDEGLFALFALHDQSAVCSETHVLGSNLGAPDLHNSVEGEFIGQDADVLGHVEGISTEGLVQDLPQIGEQCVLVLRLHAYQELLDSLGSVFSRDVLDERLLVGRVCVEEWLELVDNGVPVTFLVLQGVVLVVGEVLLGLE